MSKKKTQATKNEPQIINNKIVYWCDKVIEYGIYAIVFFVPIAYSSKLYDNWELPKMILFTNITLISLAILIVKSINNGKIKFNKSPIFLASMIYLIILVISTINSKYTLVSLYGTFKTYQGLYVMVFYIILYFVIVASIKSTSLIKNLLISIVISGTLVAICGIFEAFGHHPISVNVEILGGRSASTFGNPIFLGNFLIMVLPISIILLIKFSSPLVKINLFISTIIMFLCLLFTYSRGAWIGFIVSIILLIILLRKEIMKKDNLKWLLTLSMIVILFTTLFLNREVVSINGKVTLVERAISTFNLSEPAVGARLSIWRSALDGIKEHPIFGVGLDNFESLFPRYQRPELVKFEGIMTTVTKSHNEILQITSTMGFIGLFAYLFLLVSIIIKVMKLLKSKQDRILTFAVIGSICGLLANFTSVQFGFNCIVTGMLFWIYTGIIDINNSNRDYKEAKIQNYKVKKQGRNIAKQVTYIIIFIAIIVIVFISKRAVVGDYYFNKGMIIIQNDKFNCQDAVTYFKKASTLNPFVRDYTLELARCYYYLGKLDLAEKKYIKMLKFRPEDISSLYILALIYYEKKDFDKCIHYAQKAAKIFSIINPNDHLVHYLLGLAYVNKKLFDKAINSFKKCTTINSTFVNCYFDMAKIYYLKGQNKEAKKYLKKVITLNLDSKISKEAKELLKHLNE